MANEREHAAEAAAPPPNGQEFPKMVYAKGGKSKIVQDADEQARLGGQWKDTPQD